MEEEFENSIFTFYFNMMLYLGFWILETRDPVKKFLYFLYYHTMSSWVLFITYMGFLDLIASIPDINKTLYNICMNLFIAGTWIKTRQNLRKSERTNALRKKLYRSVRTCKDREEIKIFKAAVNDIKLITMIFYFLFAWFFPTWVILSFCSEFWGERQYPLPAKWPVEVDITNPKVFFSISTFHVIFAFYYLFQALAIDVSMFGLLVEIHREYLFLIKRIQEFGSFCDELYGNNRETQSEVKLGEINVHLKKTKARQMLREIISRQKDLLTYTEDFEYSYNVSLFIQVFAGGTLLCVNGMQAMIVSSDFSSKMAYQFGYVFAIFCDMLYLCWLTNRISTRCFEVGTALYTTPWYKMDTDVQKDISFVILRAQKPPRITSGNFVELNLQTFMALMKNMYSWLALFRQVALK